MVTWAQLRGLASLSVTQVGILLRRLNEKFEMFVKPFAEQQVSVGTKRVVIRPRRLVACLEFALNGGDFAGIGGATASHGGR